MNEITLKSVSYHYPGRSRFAITSLSMGIAKGKITALIGPNGSGKTTFLKILAGLITPESGTLLFGTRDYISYSRIELSLLIGFLTQKESVIADMTIFDYVLMGRAPFIPFWRTPKSDDIQITSELLNNFHLHQVKETSIHQISGGEFQKVRLTRLLAQQAKVLLLDEPTSHLDLKNRKHLLDVIQKESARGTTIVFATHDPDEAADIADHLILFDNGKAVRNGLTSELFTKENIESIFKTKVDVVHIKGRKVLVK